MTLVPMLFLRELTRREATMAPSYQSPEQTCSGRLFSCSEVELIEFVSSLAMVEMSSRTHCSVRSTPDGLIL